jgi:hypothetical protein
MSHALLHLTQKAIRNRHQKGNSYHKNDQIDAKSHPEIEATRTQEDDNNEHLWCAAFSLPDLSPYLPILAYFLCRSNSHRQNECIEIQHNEDIFLHDQKYVARFTVRYRLSQLDACFLSIAVATLAISISTSLLQLSSFRTRNMTSSSRWLYSLSEQLSAPLR